MSEPLTNAELNEIEKRANAATPGPWAWEDVRLDSDDLKDYEQDPNRKDLEHPLADDDILRSSCGLGFLDPNGSRLGNDNQVRSTTHETDEPAVYSVGGSMLFRPGTGMFIAHARTDVPRLIDEIRRLQVELASYAEPLADLRCLCVRVGNTNLLLKREMDSVWRRIPKAP
jgi:hypothetical protein